MAEPNADVKYSEYMKGQLMKEFDAIDYQRDGYLEKDDITKLLDKRSSGGVFDRDILGYLFNQINAKDHHSDDKISKYDFCDTYIELNIFFNDRVFEHDFKMGEINKAIHEYETQLRQAHDTEKYNKYGIMEGSTLTISVLDGIDLKAMDFNGASDPYCILQCEEFKEKTDTKSNTLNPIWDETFTFPIERGNEVLKISVWDSDYNQPGDEDDFLGQCALGIDMLKDQQKVEKYIPLHAENPYDKWQGKIHLELRWIHSVKRLLEDLIQEHRNELKRIEETKQEYLDKIYKLHKPFWWMDKTQIKELEYGEKEEREYKNDSVKKLAGSVSLTERAVSTKLSDLANPLSAIAGFKHAPWFQWLKIMIYIYTFLTFLVNIIRPDFHDLAICAIAWYFIVFPLSIKRWSFRALTFWIIFAMIIDILWLIFNFKPWWREAPYDGDMELGLRRFAWIMTILSLFFKIFVFIAFWKASVDYHTIIGEYKKKFRKDQEGRDSFSNLKLDHKEGYFRKTFA